MKSLREILAAVKSYDKACLVLLLLSAVGILWYVTAQPRDIQLPDEPEQTPTEQTGQGLSAWDMLTLAIIRTESGFDSLAVRDDCKGVFQLRPIYIEECNRLAGFDKYTHDDAFSVERSLEMFNLIQSHYNPGHDAEYAIRLHNPTADICYADRVMRNFREIVRMNEIIGKL